MNTFKQAVQLALISMLLAHMVHAARNPVFMVIQLEQTSAVTAPRCIPSSAAVGCMLNPYFFLSKEAPEPTSTIARRLVWGAGQDYQCSLHTEKDDCVDDTNNKCQWLLGLCTSSYDYLWACPGSQADTYYKCMNNNLDIQLLDFEEPVCPKIPECSQAPSAALPCTANFLAGASPTQMDTFYNRVQAAEQGKVYDPQLTGCCESSKAFWKIAEQRCSVQLTSKDCRETAGCKPRLDSKGVLEACMPDGLPLPQLDLLSVIHSTAGSSSGISKAMVTANEACQALTECNTGGSVTLDEGKLKMYQGPWNEPVSLAC